MLSNFSCFSFSPFICFPFSLVPVDRQVNNYSCICVTIPGVFETSGVVIIIDILTCGVIVPCVLSGSLDVYIGEVEMIPTLVNSVFFIRLFF